MAPWYRDQPPHQRQDQLSRPKQDLLGSILKVGTHLKFDPTRSASETGKVHSTPSFRVFKKRTTTRVTGHPDEEAFDYLTEVIPYDASELMQRHVKDNAAADGRSAFDRGMKFLETLFSTPMEEDMVLKRALNDTRMGHG